jgi:hypothetical protein
VRSSTIPTLRSVSVRRHPRRLLPIRPICRSDARGERAHRQAHRDRGLIIRWFVTNASRCDSRRPASGPRRHGRGPARSEARARLSGLSASATTTRGDSPASPETRRLWSERIAAGELDENDALDLLDAYGIPDSGAAPRDDSEPMSSGPPRQSVTRSCSRRRCQALRTRATWRGVLLGSFPIVKPWQSPTTIFRRGSGRRFLCRRWLRRGSRLRSAQ